MTQLYPFIILGLFGGSVYALASMGVVLTYKTSGVFNFAYGAVAMFCGFTFWQFRDGWHITSWISLPVLLLVVAPLIGLASEKLFRPVTSLSAEIQIVMAFGVAAFLQAIVPIFYGPQDRALTSIFPTSTFKVGATLHVSYTQLYTLLLTIAVGLLLYVLLRRTRFGLATQAVVDNRDLAAMIGVSSETVSRVAWVISTIFAGLVGILLSSSQGLDIYTLFLVVIYAFAPAVLGKLVSLPLAFAGGMILGVTQSVLQHYGNSGTTADIEASIPYLALFLLLVVYGGRLKEVRSSLKSTTSFVASGRGDRLLVQGALLVAGGLVLPLIFHGVVLHSMALGLIFSAVGLTLVVLTGWAGQISLAQFSFVGIGAFTVGHLAGHGGSAFLPAAIAGAAIAVPVGIVIGIPSLRLSGLFLALATVAFALVMDNLIFVRPSITGGLYNGLSIGHPTIAGYTFGSNISTYYLAFGLFALFAFIAVMVRRGPMGRRLQMMRDAPVGASTFGVNITLTKLIVFAGCGAAAAFAGAFYGVLQGTVTPGQVQFQTSVTLLLLVVLGGRSLVSGALIAGATYTVGYLLPGIGANVQQWLQVLLAVGVILLAKYPEGTVQVANEQLRVFSDLFRKRPSRDFRDEPTAVADAA